MKAILLIGIFLCVSEFGFALLPVIGTNESPYGDQPTVLLISMDGFRADYFEKTETPRFHELMRQGVTASNLKPVFPSVTFVNHYTIVTGLYSENHGIVNNSMWEPKTQRTFEISNLKEVNQSDWWEGEPIWVTAEKQGLKTASMFWVGSSTEINGYRPTYWFPYDESLPRSKRIQQVLDWLDLPKEKRPAFVTLYFEDADSAGHAHGPESKEVREAIKNLDSSIGELVDGLKARGIDKKIHLVLVSDHGMVQVQRNHRIRIRDYVKGDEAKIVGKGALALVWPKGDLQTKAILERTQKNPGSFRVFSKENMPIPYHYSKHPRISPLVFVANSGWYLDTGILPSFKPGVFGLHGYDNSLPEMQAIFLASGPRFPKNNKVGEILNVDIYSLIADLLGIKPALTDGRLDRISKTLGVVPNNQ